MNTSTVINFQGWHYITNRLKQLTLTKCWPKFYCIALTSSQLLGAKLLSEQLPLHAPVVLGVSCGISGPSARSWGRVCRHSETSEVTHVTSLKQDHIKIANSYVSDSFYLRPVYVGKLELGLRFAVDKAWIVVDSAVTRSGSGEAGSRWRLELGESRGHCWGLLGRHSGEGNIR